LNAAHRVRQVVEPNGIDYSVANAHGSAPEGGMAPKTLLQLAGAHIEPPRLSQATLLLVDCQNEYRRGRLKLAGIVEALAQCGELLRRARENKCPIVHVAHSGRPGGAFDREAEGGQIVDELSPIAGEPVIEKTLPNAFAGTHLEHILRQAGRDDLIVIGHATHMCLSSTVRAASELGFRTTVVASACASRDLPDPLGGVVKAKEVQRSALAELADRFAVVLPIAASLED
jgi:nicotinamidase-related amidase